MSKDLSMVLNTDARWIWPRRFKGSVNQYVRFRHMFNVEDLDSDAELLISSESNFTAFLNGVYIGSGQFHDYPDKPTYSRIRLSDLKLGENTLIICGYHFGISHSSHISAEPSLMYVLKCGDEYIYSGADTKYQLDPSYRSGDIDRMTLQLGFVFEYDARGGGSGDQDWRAIEDADIVDRPIPTERPLPMPEVKDKTEMRVVTQGRLIRERPEPAEANGDFVADDQACSTSNGVGESASQLINENETKGKSVGELMQNDFMSTMKADDLFQTKSPDLNEIDEPVYCVKTEFLEKYGVYLIVDMGREECGYITLDIEAPAGTIVDIAIGQHLADMRVRANVGGRNFASRYICDEGRQVFVHYNNRYSGRYLQLNIPRATDAVRVFHAGILPVEYPVEMTGVFSSNDWMTNKIYEVCGRTMHLCMHEHYEDTPWREQALYANDARNQALTGYYVFGEYDFPRVSFDLLGKSVRSDDFVDITAPSDAFDFCIPSFTFSWFLGMRDLLLFTGNTSFFADYIPQIKRMLDSLDSACVDGLIPCPKGPAYWHFYDWADGLDGVDGGGWLDIQTIRYDAPLNLFFILSLEAMAWSFQKLGYDDEAKLYTKRANRLKECVNNLFWDENRQLFQTYDGPQGERNHFCELTQALAVLASIGDCDRMKCLRSSLVDKDNDLVKATLSQSFYKYEALFIGSETDARWAYQDIREKWGYMLCQGATSFWETLKGQEDFDNAGSLCHGWSAIPAYFFQAHVLGILPLDPGFKKFQVKPVAGILDRLKGKVMTRYGAIDVDINPVERSIEIVHPEQTILVCDLDKLGFELKRIVKKKD